MHINETREPDKLPTLPDPTPRTRSEPGTVAQSPDKQARVAESLAPESTSRRVVAGYEIVRELGQGGMGVVYLARDTKLKREVALKMLHADKVEGRVSVARFWAEAEVMAAVRHPHVVQVFELGEHDGRPFMAMEYVGGGSLATWLKQHGSVPPHDAAAFIEHVARGVAAAHEMGIVHRDLKPGNILLQRSEVRSQRTEVRGQRSEDRRRRTDRPLSAL